MIKALSAIAIAAFVAAALTVLPGFAPQVEASVPQAARQGRPARHPPGRPGLLAAGLAEFRSLLPARRRHQGTLIREARLVTADRTLTVNLLIRHASRTYKLTSRSIVRWLICDVASQTRSSATASQPAGPSTGGRDVFGGLPVTATPAAATHIPTRSPSTATHRRARRRLWRHRHQPALRAEGSRQGRRPWRGRSRLTPSSAWRR